MAIKTVITPPPSFIAPAPTKTGAHTHQCSKYNHVWDCQYSNKCNLEKLPSAQKVIDEICMGCHMLNYGQYAS